MYKKIDDSTKTAIYGIYSGCFSIRSNFEKSHIFGFLSNDICIIYCRERNFIFAATKMRFDFLIQNR